MPPFKSSPPPLVTSTAPAIGESTCGQCRFTMIQPGDMAQVICGGAPPMPIGTPGGIVWARPSMPRGERACGLFQPKLSAIDS